MSSRWKRDGASALVALGALFFCKSGFAQQASLGVIPGIEAHARDGATYRGGVGVWGDVLMGRRRGSSFGFGPFASGWTSFRGSYAGAGMSLLLPVHEDMPIVVSLGGQETREDGEWRGGVLGSAFWGLRSVNLSSWYGMSYGFSLQLRKDFRGDGTAAMLGLQIDCEGLALPFILAGNLFR